MTDVQTVGLIDNLQHIDGLVLNEGYSAATARYSAAVGGNTGNLAFVHGTRKSIGTDIVRMGWGWSTEQVRKRARSLVISCANQIGKHVDLGTWADAIARFDMPVVLVGLGAQTPNYEDKVEIPEGTLRFLRAVESRRAGSIPNIAVRGEFTRKVLADVGVESLPVGCPSLFIARERELGATIARATKPYTRIAVAAGNPFHPANRVVEKKLMDMCLHHGAYVVQHPDVLIGLAIGANDLDETKVATVTKSLGFTDAAECREWFRRNAFSFHEAEVWMHFLKHYDAVIGARYHGVALGVQAGIPGMTVHIDNRTNELSATTGVPSLAVQKVEQMSVREVIQAAHWSEETGATFDANRKLRAGMMASFLEANQVKPSEQLLELAR